jgi:competence protein ComEA
MNAKHLAKWVGLAVPVFVALTLFLVGQGSHNAVLASVPSPSLTNAAPNAASVSPSASASPASPPSSADAGTQNADAQPSASAIESLADGGVAVNINLANESELRKLPHIGATRAKQIVELRAKIGKFKSVDDLARLKGFRRHLLAQIRPFVRV